MRTNESLPVFRSMGKSYDPPEAGTTSRAKHVIRTAFCRFTGRTRFIKRAVYVTHGRDTENNKVDMVRTSVVERRPARPLSTGFHTLEERRLEALERESAWRTLTPKEQLAALAKRPGESKKQRARILAAMTKETEAAKNPPKVGPAKPGGVNQKHTTDEKVDKQVRHAQAVANHPTTRRRGPAEPNKN